jgi:hypothetical protein
VGTAPLNGDANKHVVDGVVRSRPGSNTVSPAPPVVADDKLLVPTFDGQVDVYELN